MSSGLLLTRWRSFGCLNRDGSFILNIKERAEDGERHTYVIELILEMRRQGLVLD